MVERFVRLHLFLWRHWAVVLAACILAALASLWAGRFLKLDEDYTNMLPMSSPAIAEQVEALKRLRQTERLFFDIQTAGNNPEELALAGDRLNQSLSGIPDVGSIRYSFDTAEADVIYRQIEEQLPELMNAADLNVVESRLAAPSLESRLEWFKKSLGQPQGMMLGPALQMDPAGVSDFLLQRLRVLQAGVGDAQISGGHIVSADGRHLLLTTEPTFRSSDLKRSRPMMDRVLAAARAVEAECPGARIAVTGAHRMALDNARMIQHDTVWTSSVATVMVLVLMFAAFRRRWLAFLNMAPTLFGAMGATLAFYLAGNTVSAVALGCGSILIGVTVDYGIYVLYHSDDPPAQSREQLARRVAKLAPTLAFGALTTMAAFVIMLMSPVSGHRQLGAFSMLGVFFAAAFAIVILPIFVPISVTKPVSPLPLTRIMEILALACRKHSRFLILLMGLLSCAAAVGMVRLRFDGDLTRLNGATVSTLQDEQTIRHTWGQALSLTMIVVEGATREEALEKNERVAALLRQPQVASGIESISSIAALCPSESTRRANQKAWELFWTGERRAAFSNTLAQASAKLGFRMDAFAPFLKRISPPFETDSAAQSDQGGLNLIFSEYVNNQSGRISISTMVKLKDRSYYPALREWVVSSVPGARLLNKAVLNEQITQVARRGLPVFAWMVVALNAALLFLYLGRVELVLIALAPMAAGVFWTLGLMGLFGMPIDLSNFIFVIFVIGVGGDYSLFLLMAGLESLRGRTGQPATTSGAVTICAGTTLLGVGVLVMADHPALFSVGMTALLGITLSWLAALLLVPMGLEILRRSQVRPIAIVSPSGKRAAVRRLYRYQGPYVSQFVFWKTQIDPLFNALEENLSPVGTVLDLGCGFGIAAHWLTINSPGRTVIGLDQDAFKIESARATATFNPRVRFELADVLQAEFQPCDAVLMCDLLHYLPRELKEALLHKAFAALKPDGRLLIRDAFDEARSHGCVAVSEKIGVWLGQNKTAYGLHFESLNTYRRMIEAAGFGEIEVVKGSGQGSNQLLIAMKNRA